MQNNAHPGASHGTVQVDQVSDTTYSILGNQATYCPSSQRQSTRGHEGDLLVQPAWHAQHTRIWYVTVHLLGVGKFTLPERRSQCCRWPICRAMDALVDKRQQAGYDLSQHIENFGQLVGNILSISPGKDILKISFLHSTSLQTLTLALLIQKCIHAFESREDSLKQWLRHLRHVRARSCVTFSSASSCVIYWTWNAGSPIVD